MNNRKVSSNKRKRALYAVEKLSSAGRDTVDLLLSRGATYEGIGKELLSKTGERISQSALARYRSKVFLKPERKRTGRDVLIELLNVSREIRDAIRALDARLAGIVQSGPGRPGGA